MLGPLTVTMTHQLRARAVTWVDTPMLVQHFASTVKAAGSITIPVLQHSVKTVKLDSTQLQVKRRAVFALLAGMIMIHHQLHHVHLRVRNSCCHEQNHQRNKTLRNRLREEIHWICTAHTVQTNGSRLLCMFVAV